MTKQKCQNHGCRIVKKKTEPIKIDQQEFDVTSNSVREKSDDLLLSDLKRSPSYDEQMQKVKMVRQRSR